MSQIGQPVVSPKRLRVLIGCRAVSGTYCKQPQTSSWETKAALYVKRLIGVRQLGQNFKDMYFLPENVHNSGAIGPNVLRLLHGETCYGCRLSSTNLPLV